MSTIMDMAGISPPRQPRKLPKFEREMLRKAPGASTCIQNDLLGECFVDNSLCPYVNSSAAPCLSVVYIRQVPLSMCTELYCIDRSYDESLLNLSNKRTIHESKIQRFSCLLRPLAVRAPKDSDSGAEEIVTRHLEPRLES